MFLGIASQGTTNDQKQEGQAPLSAYQLSYQSASGREKRHQCVELEKGTALLYTATQRKLVLTHVQGPLLGFLTAEQSAGPLRNLYSGTDSHLWQGTAKLLKTQLLMFSELCKQSGTAT